MISLYNIPSHIIHVCPLSLAGHGTHVCGTIAGSIQNSQVSQYSSCPSGTTVDCRGICSTQLSWASDSTCSPQFNCYANSCDNGACSSLQPASSPFRCSNSTNDLGLTGNTGMAPEAQIAFFDIAFANESLKTPDFLQFMFEVQREAGAYIHSNSWGASFNAYMEEDAQVDDFSYRSPVCLYIYMTHFKDV